MESGVIKKTLPFARHWATTYKTRLEQIVFFLPF
jgi:hypothetical protein